jgi:hypothetical protein
MGKKDDVLMNNESLQQCMSQLLECVEKHFYTFLHRKIISYAGNVALNMFNVLGIKIISHYLES